MASLSPSFILCPLPDRNNLLGIRQDRLQNKAIITLGKNIAIRYHILEQKQESSWTTSRYWFTSPVTFCYDVAKYVAILNHNILALWDEGDTSLAKFDKVKLQDHAFALYSKHDGRSVVVMKNGNAAYVTDLMNDRRIVKSPLLDPKEIIVSAEVDEGNSRCFLITRSEGQIGSAKELSVVVIGIENGSNIIARHRFGEDVKDILGFCLCISEGDTFIVYLGGDGFIYKSKIAIEEDKLQPLKLSNLNKNVSEKSPVIMCPLSDNSSVAIYGCDAAEEGAVVLVYDIQYDLVISKQPLKLYSTPPFMERIGLSLFVPHGLHILVLNFRMTKSLLSTMVGKHQAKLDEEVFEGRNPWTSRGWDPDVNKPKQSLEIAVKVNRTPESDELKKIKETYPAIWETIQQVKTFEAEGQPEAVICNHVIPDAIEKRNGEALEWILSTFLDIPEVHIVSMVVFSLRSVQLAEENDKINTRLNSLLLRKFDKHLLTQSLRYVAYDDVKKLLLYINCLIKNHWELDFELEDESPMKAWLKWCSSLVDAHYTKFVLHNDVKIVESLLDSISQCTNFMNDVAEMEPYLVMTFTKNSFEPALDTSEGWRTETVTFE